MADIAKMMEEIKGMTVLELNNLVKALEEEFGVSAAAMAVAAPAAGGEAAPAAEDTTAYAYLYEIDVNEATYKRYNDLYDEMAALIIPVKGEGGSWTAPTDVITDMQISAESASLLKGSTLALTASVLPWTVVDRSVTWTSDNEAVATVDENGVVTAVSAGNAVITATSNLDDSFSVSCEISVTALEITINGTLQDAEGNPMFYSWNMETDDTWTGGTAIDTSMVSATYNSVNKTKSSINFIDFTYTDRSR